MLAQGGGALREAAQSLERLLRVEVQTQVRRLHGDLGVETSPFDQVEEPEVVLRDGIGVGRALDVLAQERERHRDPFRRKSFRGLEGVLHRLAGHEAPDGRADEPEPREVIAQPMVPRGEEDRFARRVHERIASTSRLARSPVSIAPSM